MRPSTEPHRRLALVMAGLSGLGVLALVLIALRALASRSPGHHDAVEHGVQSLSTVPSAAAAPVAPAAPTPLQEPAPQVEPPSEAPAPPGAVPAQAIETPTAVEPAPTATALPPTAEKPSPALAPAKPAPAAPSERVPVTTPPWKTGRQAQGAASSRRAWLTITSSSPAQVFVDGAPLGRTPLEDVRIAPGMHEVAFVRDGVRSAETVEIRAGEHKRVSQDSQPATGDGLDQAVVQRTIRSNSPAVRDDCWQPAVSARTPDAPPSARVNVTITVSPSGDVQSVDSAGVPAAYPQLSRCIETKVSAWKFPSARGETVVNVPFVFVTE